MALVPLYRYQQEYLADQSRRKASLWCRSAGKTFIVMLEPVLDCQRAMADGRRVDWFCFAGAESQTEEMIRYAGIHAQAVSLAFELSAEEYDVGDHKTTLSKIEFEGGSRIVGLPTNPLSIRGRHGNLIWGEAGKTPNDEVMATAALPIATRGFKVRLEGTPGERRGPFYEIVTGRPGWSVHRVDIHRAIADGAPITVEDVQASVGTGAAYRKEYLLEFEDAESRLLALNLIARCEDPATLLCPILRVEEGQEPSWAGFLDGSRYEAPPSAGYDAASAWRRLFAPLAEGGRDLYLGYDVGRRKDLAVLWVVERDGFLRRTRAVVAFSRRRYAEQEAALYAALAHCRRGCIDASGLGEQLAERAVEKFGQAKVESVKFTSAVKEDLAGRLLRGCEDWTLRLPPSTAVRDSLHSVYKITTSAKQVRYDAATTEEAGHADYFWAAGLALMAAGDDRGANLDQVQSWGAPRFSRAEALA